MGNSVANPATIDLNAVAVFVRVVEAGSFTRAAEQLGLPKSAVSRRVARLEESLGTRLLQRSTRRLSLTEAGSRYHRQATTALGTLSDAARDVGELQDEPRGVVRFTAPNSLVTDYLIEPLAKFARHYPRVSVELVLTTRMVDLVAEGIDFALRGTLLRDSALIARKVAPTPLIPVATPAYLARRGVPREPADLVRHDCILYKPENGRNRWRLTAADRERTVTVMGPAGADDIRVVYELALAGMGIGLIPNVSVSNDLGKQRLVRVLPSWCGPKGGLFLVYPPARHVPQRVLLLREQLFSHLRKALAPARASR